MYAACAGSSETSATLELQVLSCVSRGLPDSSMTTVTSTHVRFNRFYLSAIFDSAELAPWHKRPNVLLRAGDPLDPRVHPALIPDVSSGSEARRTDPSTGFVIFITTGGFSSNLDLDLERVICTLRCKGNPCMLFLLVEGPQLCG